MPHHPRSRSRRGLSTWLADAATPLFLLDARRKVLFFNHGCERLTGWNAGDVIGQICDYVSEPDPSQVESLTGSLCPPPEVFEGREETVPAFVITRSGEKLARLTKFIPLRNDDGSVERVLGVISPIPDPPRPLANTPDRQLHAELASIRTDLRKRYEVTSLVGRSAVCRRILQQITLARQSRISVHLQGEPGTGREYIARLIHYQSADRLRAFVPVDCRRLTADQIRQMLEHVFTEVVQSEIPHLRPGALLLRNVDELPADLQNELVERYAGADPPALRLMSDSQRPLAEAVSADRMSEACFELLTTLVVRVPPLRERMEDLPLLAQDMLERHNRDRDSQVSGFTEPVWSAFRKYNWPGNQDELHGVVRQAREACSGKLITLSDLPFGFRTGQDAQRANPPRATHLQPLAERLEEVEREHIRQALELSEQNKSQAAERLGINRPRLYRRMQQLGMIADAGEPD
jgi:DNA-binding NtrC family response regulator